MPRRKCTIGFIQKHLFLFMTSMVSCLTLSIYTIHEPLYGTPSQKIPPSFAHSRLCPERVDWKVNQTLLRKLSYDSVYIYFKLSSDEKLAHPLSREY